MKLLKYVALAVAVSFSSCTKELLDKEPIGELTDPAFWNSESNIRTYSFGFYNSYFKGYGSGFTWAKYFSGESLNDDFAPTTPTQFTLNVPTSGGGWSPTLPATQTPTGVTSYYSRIRKANHFIASIPLAKLSKDVENNWIGVGRFLRALEYASFVNAFGDVPYIDRVLAENDPEMYRERDARTFVMDKVLEDFKFAAENVRPTATSDKLEIDRNVVLAHMSRIFLFEGTWLKYHNIDATRAKTYLEAAKWAANEVIKTGKFALNADYRGLFTSEDLKGNSEIILYRQYTDGVLSHSLLSYNNLEVQTGISKNAVDNFLGADGLPIALSKVYQGDTNISNVLANRDPRLQATVGAELRIMNMFSNYSSTGYVTHKFLNEAIKNTVNATGSKNTTDAPVIRYGEVLMNYAEAAAELGNLTQADLDLSINVLRARKGVNLPKLQVLGGQPAVNDVVYDDPARDKSVSSLLWEIRRERRSELIFEGFRRDDLRRWKKLTYADTELNPSINLGAYINLDDYKNDLKGIYINSTGRKGYIVPAPAAATQRRVLDKYYLDPIPIDQITLYQQNGKTLTQNPGW